MSLKCVMKIGSGCILLTQYLKESRLYQILLRGRGKFAKLSKEIASSQLPKMATSEKYVGFSLYAVANFSNGAYQCVQKCKTLPIVATLRSIACFGNRLDCPKQQISNTISIIKTELK